MRIRADYGVIKMSKLLLSGLLVSGTIFSTQFAPSQFALSQQPVQIPRVANVNEPPPETSTIVRTVRALVEREHISHPQFDDEMSYRGFDIFLRNIDPLKSYLLQSDIDEFMVYRDKLDDLIKVNDIRFAYIVYKKYLTRMEEVMPYIHEQIDATHDFTADEYMPADAKEMAWAANDAELKDRIRKKIKLEILALRAEKKSEEEIKSTLHKRYKTIQNMKVQLDVDELLELYLTSLTSSLDPHTTYMSPREQDDFDVHLKLKFFGIGATLRPDGGQTVVENVVPGGAADKDGRLKPGDLIVGVSQDGETAVVETVDMKLQDVVAMIRGPKGTKVNLHVKVGGTGDTKIYQITRDIVNLEEDAARAEIIEHGEKPDGSKYKIGFINLPSFYLDMEGARRGSSNFRSTHRDIAKIIEDFKTKGVEAIVLDLSRNGGGSLQEAIATTGLFIERGPVVQVKTPSGRVESLDDEESMIAWTGPLVVKNSKMSASASEIFAGAIQNYSRGLIVGDPNSHGKGTVQTLLDLAQFIGSKRSQGGLKLTIQQFYLPDGRSTQLEGVSSDVVLPSITAKLDISESDLDYPIPEGKVRAQPHKDYQMVSSAMKADLQSRANARISENADFGKLLDRIETYVRQKAEKQIPLNEEAYMARRKEYDSEKEEEEELMPKPKDRAKVFIDDYYNREVLSITCDYIDLLRQSNKIVAK